MAWLERLARACCLARTEADRHGGSPRSPFHVLVRHQVMHKSCLLARQRGRPEGYGVALRLFVSYAKMIWRMSDVDSAGGAGSEAGGAAPAGEAAGSAFPSVAPGLGRASARPSAARE